MVVLFYKFFNLLFDLIDFVVRKLQKNLHLVCYDLGVVGIYVVFEVYFVLLLAKPELDREIEYF